MTINIPLIDNYRILSDKYNFILAREENNRITHESFHSSIKGCVESLIDKKIRGFDSNSIHSLLEAIKSLQTRLNKALQPLELEVVSKKEVKKENE